MQTHVPAQADQAKQQQSKAAPQPTQLVSEQQGEFVDNRPEMAAGLQLRQLMDSSRQAVAGRALQAMMNTSAQAREGRAMQAMMNKSTLAREAQSVQLMLNTIAQANPPVQRVEEEEPLQAKAASENTAQLEAAEAPKPNNTGLPDNLKSGIESLSGMSMDHVKVHYNSSQPAQLNAHAYAQSSEIHVAPGQEQHLPHEAWHVVQQAQGRVKPTMQMKAGVPVNDDVGLEAEADVMGAKALAMPAISTPQKHSGILNAPVQMKGRQKAKIAREGERKPIPGNRRERLRQEQEADLLENEKRIIRKQQYIEQQEREERAIGNFKKQEEIHGPNRRRKEGYALHEEKLERAKLNRDKQEAEHAPRRDVRDGRTQSEQRVEDGKQAFLEAEKIRKQQEILQQQADDKKAADKQAADWLIFQQLLNKASASASTIQKKTSDVAIAALTDRISFNLASATELPKVANFVTYRNRADQFIKSYAGANATTANDIVVLQQDMDSLTAIKTEVVNVGSANNDDKVAARKKEMFSAEAVDALQAKAYGFNSNAFSNATTFAAASLALAAWAEKYFSLDRSRIIEAAKTRADNGAPGNATVWKGLSAQVKGYTTHMTIYNSEITHFANYLVTAASDRAASDGLADKVLANGAAQGGIHLTAEINPYPTSNPRVFGNPPNAARHSYYVLPGTMAWADFVAPLTAAQDEVRKDVWPLIDGKRDGRP